MDSDGGITVEVVGMLIVRHSRAFGATGDDTHDDYEDGIGQFKSMEVSRVETGEKGIGI